MNHYVFNMDIYLDAKDRIEAEKLALRISTMVRGQPGVTSTSRETVEDDE